jgi:uncharacterized membrane protein
MELFSIEGWYVLLRWAHVLAGITWIGILYYFNFVQTPFFGSELGGQAKSAMTRGLVPNALWWFRWGAMFTFISGLLILLTKWGHDSVPLSSGYMTLILPGALMGILMWFNVWFVIWPAQQVVIANAEKVAGGGEADPAAPARAGRAGVASRTNTLFSIPMLFFMVSAANFPSVVSGLATGTGNLLGFWAFALLVIAAVEANALIGTGTAPQSPLKTVSGTIHSGLVITILLYAMMVVFL